MKRPLTSCFVVFFLILTSAFAHAQDLENPLITILNPESGTMVRENHVSLDVTTDVNSVCQYMLVFCDTGSCSGNSYEDMSETGGLEHHEFITGLAETNEGERYNIYVKCTDESDNSNLELAEFSVRIRPIVNIDYSAFSGDTTYFSDLTGEEMENMEGVVFEVLEDGMIIFHGPINISRDLDIDSCLEISHNLISLDSQCLPEFNRYAVLYLYNLSFSDPMILMDGNPCPSSVCNKLGYENGILVFSVSHFTWYSAAETPKPPPSGGGSTKGKRTEDYCSNDYCGSEENCSTCPEDCGTCCTEDWACGEWSECSPAGVQNRTCTENNNCGTFVNEPAQLQICEYEEAEEEIPETLCGNGVCESDEDCESCPEDCGACPPPIAGGITGAQVTAIGLTLAIALIIGLLIYRSRKSRPYGF